MKRKKRRSAFPVRLIPAFALSTISVLFAGVLIYFLLLPYGADVPPSGEGVYEPEHDSSVRPPEVKSPVASPEEREPAVARPDRERVHTGPSPELPTVPSVPGMMLLEGNDAAAADTLGQPDSSDMPDDSVHFPEDSTFRKE